MSDYSFNPKMAAGQIGDRGIGGCSAAPPTPIASHSFLGVASRWARARESLTELRRRVETITRKVVGAYPVQGDLKPESERAPADNIIGSFHHGIDDVEEELRYLNDAVNALEGAVP